LVKKFTLPYKEEKLYQRFTTQTRGNKLLNLPLKKLPKGWHSYLAGVLRYPSDARSVKTEGTVFLLLKLMKMGRFKISRDYCESK
jgi:hypothetical protein